MTTFNASIEHVNALTAMLALLAGTVNPLTTLYGLLAGTCGGAAVAAGANDHHSLRRCYFVSAVVYGLIGVCHHLGI